MPRQPLGPTTLYLSLIVLVIGCDTALDEQLGVVKARDLSGTYTGVLQGVTAETLDDTEDPRRRVIVDIDLLHELTIQEAGELTLRIESDLIPALRAIVVGIGGVAVNAEFVEFEELDVTDEEPRFEALKVKQIVFVEYEGEWVTVLQIVRIGVEKEENVDDVYVYQYVSYPSHVAEQMGEEEAILYVNMILRLASAAQRM